MSKLFSLIVLLCTCVLYSAAQKPAGDPLSPKPPFSLDEAQRRHFRYFWDLADSTNWQIPDRYPSESFSSIAATGFGLSAYLVGVERGWITRAQAAERVLKTLTFLKNLPQGPQPTGVAGYRGWYYHFLDTKTALRFKTVELSSIDTGLLMAGILSCMTYFDQSSSSEKGIRETADFLYRRVEFDWYLNESNRLSMGWFPERGFLAADWRGYNEAMVLVLLAIGSPTHPVPPGMWQQWCKPYFRQAYKGQDMVNFGPLFGHQYSHCWVDFRGIQDAYMRKMGIDYQENSKRATYANRQYCIDNPKKFVGYSPTIWGLTAGDGPGYAEVRWNGQKQVFDGYSARGAAADYLVDDGTIAPTAAISSIAFAPDICLPALQAMWEHYPVGPYGFFDGYNETFTWADQTQNGQPGMPYWVDKDYLGIDQGPIVLMLENYRSGFLWNLMQKNPYIVAGLRKAGFTGGWLDKSPVTVEKDGAARKFSAPNPDVPMEPAGYFKREIYQDAAGNQLPYQFMEPKKNALLPAAESKYPLVVFLHSSGERGTDNFAQMRNGVYAFCEKEMREKHPCYLLVPQCPPDEVWGGVTRDWEQVTFNKATYSKPGKMVIELIEKTIRANSDIDPKRIYITGLSMGGFGTYDLMMRKPNLFAAGLPLCGGADPAQAALIKGIPIWAFHGRLDDSVYPKYDWQIVEALRKAGSPVKYTEYSTMGHNIWDITYYNPAVLEWLFAQHK